MTFADDLVEFALENTDGEGELIWISVERCDNSVWDTSEMDTTYVADINYPRSDSPGFDKHLVALNDDNIKEQLDNIIRRLDDRIEVTNELVDVESPSVRLSVRDVETPDGETPNIGHELDSDITAMRKIMREQAGCSPDVRGLVSLVSDEVQEEIGDTVTLEDYENVEFYFSDFKVCELSGVRSDIITDSPHLYYLDVDSVEEYVAEATNPKKRSDGQYSAFFRLDYEDGEIGREFIPEHIRGAAEEVMKNRMDDYLSVSGTYSYEAERISVEDKLEETTFFLRQDVEEVLD